MHSLLTAKDVARHLRMHIITVYRLAEQGKIPAVKVGRQWRFHQDVIDEWARGRKQLDRRALFLASEDGEGGKTAEALRSAGCGVVVVRSADEVARLLSKKQRRFSAFFVDGSAERGTVLAAAREMASAAPSVPIVLVTDGHFAEILDEVLEITHATVARAPLTPREAERVLATLS